MLFQGMFAVITPALIIGAFAERMKFSAFLLFSFLWATLVYDPVCHWIWGLGGWLRNMGVLDFAGGTVVHVNAGVAALVTAIIIGKRKNFDFDRRPIPPHNLSFTVLGTGLLWFGWFGFNGGSALTAGGVAVNAFVTTNSAAAVAGLTWAALEWLLNGKPTLLGTVSGIVAGLASVTQAAGFVGVMPAMFIGLCGSVFCFFAVSMLKRKLNYDDSLDVFGVHGIGGIWGGLATGLFASKLINPAGANGLFFGHPRQFLIQAVAVGVTAAYTFVATFLIYKLIDLVIGVRVAEKDEIIGLDLTQHHETGYTVLE
jgi:Amt family ammonium transporter